jgi:hypothetical protein
MIKFSLIVAIILGLSLSICPLDAQEEGELIALVMAGGQAQISAPLMSPNQEWLAQVTSISTR